MKQKLLIYFELCKPEVTFLVVITTLAGFYLGSRGALDVTLLCHTLLGTFLVAGGTNALNQLIERDQDARMKRTRRRPLPSGKISPTETRIFASLISAVGILYLALVVNLLTGLLAALTLGLYAFVYTPLKRKTSLSTIIGAVPGALPPVGGWAAVRGEIGAEALALFAILFFWQIPHFLAIAWIYRNDYARGGFQVLPLSDRTGIATGRQIVLNCVVLLLVSLFPTFLGLAGKIYFVGALVLGVGFLASGVSVALEKSNLRAKQLLHASIIYLPILLALMSFDRL